VLLLFCASDQMGFHAANRLLNDVLQSCHDPNRLLMAKTLGFQLGDQRLSVEMVLLVEIWRGMDPSRQNADSHLSLVLAKQARKWLFSGLPTAALAGLYMLPLRMLCIYAVRSYPSCTAFFFRC
jgi:hypothetical protein